MRGDLFMLFIYTYSLLRLIRMRYVYRYNGDKAGVFPELIYVAGHVFGYLTWHTTSRPFKVSSLHESGGRAQQSDSGAQYDTMMPSSPSLLPRLGPGPVNQSTKPMIPSHLSNGTTGHVQCPSFVIHSTITKTQNSCSSSLLASRQYRAKEASI